MKIVYKKEITEADKQAKDAKYISLDIIDVNFGRIGDLGLLPDRLILPEHRSRICQVFWSKPYKMAFQDARWKISNQFELTLPLCALSLAMLKEMGQDVVMYTDTIGQGLLQGLGYDRIYNIFDNMQVPNDFWACGKIMALQNEPLDSLLMDTDIFLYDGKILDKAYKLEVVGSHTEPTDLYVGLLKLGGMLFEHLRGDLSRSTNTGFLKVANLHKKLKFISAYWAGLKRLSDRQLLQKFKDEGKGAYCADLLLEQFNFHKLCQPDPLIDLPQAQEEARGFVHLITFEKYLKVPLVLDILLERYPKYYKRVIEKWNELGFSVQVEDKVYGLH